MVDAEGNATSCHIQRKTVGEGFGDAACNALMRNADFAPALDRNGQPMDSYYNFAIRFDIGQR